MRKAFALLVAMIIVLSLAACGIELPDPTAGDYNTPDGGEQQPSDTDEIEASPTPGESDDTDSLEYLLSAEGLPGLTAPEGASYETGMFGVLFTKEGDFTREEKMAYIQYVWDFCSQLSPDGIYNNDQLETKYASITDKYPDFESDTFESFQLEWFFVHDGEIRSASVMGSTTIEVFGFGFGEVE
ncbi:MAG: hypothetical protein Q4B99_00875 [Clostridia bacterium]|nr:hypothetical protein [Clostridia bacterium]